MTKVLITASPDVKVQRLYELLAKINNDYSSRSYDLYFREFDLIKQVRLAMSDIKRETGLKANDIV